jgi:hypothetical protein
MFNQQFRRNPSIMQNQANDLPPPLPPQQSPGWVPDNVWEPPRRRNNLLYDLQRNNALYGTQPVEPPPGSVDAPGTEIDAASKEVFRLAGELTSSIDRLYKASTGRKIGIGHNQAPFDEVAWAKDLIALLGDEGPRIKTTADAKHLTEQTERVKRLPERIWSWLKAGGLLVAGVGVHKVTEDLTAPLWDEVAHRVVELCHAIEVWVSLLPPQ